MLTDACVVLLAVHRVTTAVERTIWDAPQHAASGDPLKDMFLTDASAKAPAAPTATKQEETASSAPDLHQRLAASIAGFAAGAKPEIGAAGSAGLPAGLRELFQT